MKAAFSITGASMMHGVPGIEEMGDDEFEQWVRLIERRTGTVVAPQRKSFLVTNLNIRMREIGCSSYGSYYDLIMSGIGGLKEWAVFVDRITVHETRFFRHQASLELVRDLVMNKAVEEKSQKVSIHAWSAGCSTGEEAYTLAMTIDDHLGSRIEDGFFGVTATDISHAALQVGRAGVYSQKRVDEIKREYRNKYLVAAGHDKYQVQDDLRKRVCFAQLNILDLSQAALGKMDLIYCQNLLIYFERDIRKMLVDRMVEHLLPGGLLILGSGELVGWSHPGMEKIACDHTLAYRRVR